MIDVELSNIWGSVSLPDLLSGEKDLFDAHMQLRTNSPDGPDFLGWLNAPEGVMARAVLAIGSEGRGLSDEVLALCDETVRIPMSPRCESLNAAVAASVLLWEAYR